MATNERQFTITGIIRDKASKRPMPGLLVKAYDVDRATADDHLGDARTDAHGRFEIQYREDDFVRSILESFLEGGPDIVLKVFLPTDEKQPIHTEPERSDASRFETYEIEVDLRAQQPWPKSLSSRRIPKDFPAAQQLARLGITSLSQLRRVDVEALAKDERAARAGLSGKRIAELKGLAHLSVLARPSELRALDSIHAVHLRDIALVPADKLRQEMDRVMSGGRLNAADCIPQGRLKVLRNEARHLLNQSIRSQIAALTLAQDICSDCAEDCCADPTRLSVLSKPAYLAYLVRKTGLAVDKLGEQYFQDFAAPNCERVFVVRLGIEVLERALLGGAFASASRRSILRLMVTDRMLIRQALLSRTWRLEPAKVREAATAFGTNPLAGAPLATEAELQQAVDAATQSNRDLRDWLSDPANSQLGLELIESTWLRATGHDFERTASELGAGWDAELNALGAPAQAGELVESAHAYRQSLIAATGLTASELRASFHVNFMSMDGSLERCEQAILTLQGILSCNQPTYVACCTSDAVDWVAPRFMGYDEYRLWVDRHLHPANYYDIHVKSPLVRGDISALKQQLTLAGDVLEEVSSANEDHKSIMNLWRQGLQTVDGLLGIDELVSRGHTAYRDEEYALALALYRQAAERIRTHVRTYHSAELATYDELFAHDPAGGWITTCDGKSRLGSASAMTQVLNAATLRTGLTRRLVSTERLKGVEEATSAWWPPDRLLPTLQELSDMLDRVVSGDPVMPMLEQAGLVRRELGLTNLENKLREAGLQTFNVTDGLRFNRPFILREGFEADETLKAAFNDGLLNLLVELAWPRIQGKLAELVERLAVDTEGLRTCLQGVWGTNQLGVDEALNFPQLATSSLGCLQAYASAVAGTFTALDIGGWADGCAVRVTQSLIVGTVSVVVGYDPGCIVSKIVGEVESRVHALPELNLNSPEDLRNSIGSLTGTAKELIGQGIAEWFLLDFDEEAAFGNDEATRTFRNSILDALYEDLLVEDRPAWIARNSALREVSNLYSPEDLRLYDDRPGRYARRGTILFDAESAGNEDVRSFLAQVDLSTGDNDDLGIAFRFREEEGGASYYLLTFRNGFREAETRGSHIAYMQMCLAMLMAAYATSPESNIPELAIPVVAPPAFYLWLVLSMDAENYWHERFPEDHGGSFVRLMKVRARGSASPEIVKLEEVDVVIKTDHDYSIRLEVSELPSGALRIQADISEPEADRVSLGRIETTDQDPIAPGGLGLYAFSNEHAEFKRAELTYQPLGSASLGKLLFVPTARDGVEPALDWSAYDGRRYSPSEDVKKLSDWVSLDIDGFRIVAVGGPAAAGSSASDSSDDPIDLSPYRAENPGALQYRLFDARVDRFALAELTNGLCALLPHFYFFALPLSIADALHAAGDYEGAKRHYDLIYDPFPHEVWRPADGEASRVFADPAARQIGYEFLHVSLPDLDQVGIEDQFLRIRHAANFLAAGEAEFTSGTAEARQRAAGRFAEVLLSHGRTTCCDGWEGEVTCRPGAPEVLAPTPSDGNGQSPTEPGRPDPVDACEANERELERLIGLLPADGQRWARDAWRELRRRTEGDRQAYCAELAEVLSDVHAAMRAAQSARVNSSDGRAGLNAAETYAAGIVDLRELGYESGFRIRPGEGGVIILTPSDQAGAEGTEPAEVGCDLEDLAILGDLLQVYTCIPVNPLVRAQLERACLYLYLLDQNLNVLGLREDERSAYRYEYLLNLARTFANFAIAAEKDFIQFREKLSAARLSVMDRTQSVQLLGAQARVQELGLQQAGNQVRLGNLQIRMAQTRDHHLDQLLALNDIAMLLAAGSLAVGVGSGALGLAGAGLGVVGAGVTLGGAIATAYTGGAATPVALAGLGLVGAGIGLGSSGMGMAGGVLSGVQGMFNVYQQRVMLQQQQELLRDFELPIARLIQRNALLAERIARRQIEIAQLQIRFAEQVLTYLSNQLLNADTYALLARLSKQHYREYLGFAARAALMAERALEHERGRQFNLVKVDYFNVSLQGLLGGEALQQDLGALEYQRFVQDDRRVYPPVKVYSLADAFSLEFEHFRRKGELWFQTSHLDFDRDFPGHYRRQIRSVRVLLYALVGYEGVKATLAQAGASEIVEEQNGRFVITPLPGVLQSVPLYGSSDGRGLIPLNPVDGRLNPFEATGVAATWRLELPRASNQINFESIVNVLFLIEYSAYSNVEYGETVRTLLAARAWQGTRTQRFRLNFPDALYHLVNPSPSGPQLATSVALNLRSTSVTLRRTDYAPNETDRTLFGMVIGFYDDTLESVALDELRVASRRHIEAMWRANLAQTSVAALSDPTKTTVLRGGELVTVGLSEVRPGETASPGIWVRVLRSRQLIWVPQGQQVSSDRLLSSANMLLEPLPDALPADLVQKAQVVVPSRSGTHPYTGNTQRIFDLRVRDDGTPPMPGHRRVLRNGEIQWVSSLQPGETEIGAGQWDRVLESGRLTWKATAAMSATDIGFSAEDTWYMTLEPAGSASAIKRQVGGFDVIDLSRVMDIAMLVSYHYSLPAYP